jgi:hypothetical protein
MGRYAHRRQVGLWGPAKRIPGRQFDQLASGDTVRAGRRLPGSLSRPLAAVAVEAVVSRDCVGGTPVTIPTMRNLRLRIGLHICNHWLRLVFVPIGRSST